MLYYTTEDYINGNNLIYVCGYFKIDEYQVVYLGAINSLLLWGTSILEVNIYTLSETLRTLWLYNRLLYD